MAEHTRGRARLLAACLGVLAACATDSSQLNQPSHPQNPPGRWYVVQPGQTLAGVAAEAGIPVEDVVELNGLKRGQKLEAGQIIYLLSPVRAADTAATPVAAEAPPRAELPRGKPTAGGRLHWPVAEPRVTSLFGTRQGRNHEGLDLSAPTGTPVLAADDGEILYAGDAVRGYGNMVVIQHGGELMTVYAHNSIVLVRQGDRVRAGQEIARVGQSGRASAPHLHFEVRQSQVPRDPMEFLAPLK